MQHDLLGKLHCTHTSDLQHPALLLTSGAECAPSHAPQVYGKDGVFDADRLIDLLSAFEDYSVASKSAQGECHRLQQHTKVCLVLVQVMHTVPTLLLNGDCALWGPVLVQSPQASHLGFCAEVAGSHQRPVLVLLLTVRMPPVHAHRSFGCSDAGLQRVHPASCCVRLYPVSPNFGELWLHRCSLCC